MNRRADSISPKKKSLYVRAFEKHVQKFMDDNALTNPTKQMVVAVSGGVDSLTLLHLLKKLNFNFLVLHFNHQTRHKENKLEEELVRASALKLNLDIRVVYLSLNLDDKNFEQKARVARRKIYKEYIEQGAWVYTGHHIDDSFEWSLMQSFKQASLRSSLGIPLFGHGIVRPFLCVTKKQLCTYAHYSLINWLEDSSNKSLKYERNFLRAKLTVAIEKKYPRALRHYVARQNELARLLKCHRQQQNKKSNAEGPVIKRDPRGGVLLIARDFSPYKSIIKDWIHFFSQKKRGEIDNEVDKLIISHQNITDRPSSFPAKGPMDFSGGVKIFLMKNHLYIMGERHLSYYQELDQKLLAYFQNLSQIPELVLDHFPFLFLAQDKKMEKRSRFIHPLLPKTCDWLKKESMAYSFTPLIPFYLRQKLILRAVILDSSSLGL